MSRLKSWVVIAQVLGKASRSGQKKGSINIDAPRFLNGIQLGVVEIMDWDYKLKQDSPSRGMLDMYSSCIFRPCTIGL